MIGLLVALLLGIVIGLMRGGSLKTLSAAELGAVPLVFVGVAFQVGSAIAEHSPLRWLPLALILVSFLCVLGFAALNFALPGMTLIGAGAMSNLLVISINGGMPVSGDAIARAGLDNPFVGPGSIEKGAHHLMTAADKLRFLGDVIPVRVMANVFSVGDVLIWAGLLLMIAQLMVGPRGKRRLRAPPKVTARSGPG